MLRPDDGGLGEDGITDGRFNGFDLLDGLLFRETVQKEIDI